MASGMDAEALREFYFSAGQNFAAFKNKKDKSQKKGDERATASPTKSEDGAPPTADKAAPAAAEAEKPAAKPAAAEKPAEKPAAPPPAQGKVKGDVATAEAAKPKAPSPEAGAGRKPSGPPAGSGAALAAAKKQPKEVPAGMEAASQEYILFLKQQQDLQRCHNKLEEILSTFEHHRRNEMRELAKVRRQGAELVVEMEAGTNWNLKSKYTVENLIKDAGILLHPKQLYSADMEPQYLDVTQQVANLTKLKQDHQDKEQYEPHKVVISNGIRRLDRVEKEIKSSQLDATDLARVPDTLLIQLEHVFNSPTLKTLLAGPEDTLEHLLFKLEKAKEEREAALDDGEMLLAEKHYYTIVELYEDLQNTVLQSLAIIDKTQKETAVFNKVRETYQQKATDEINRLRNDKEQLKDKCEKDIQKLFALRERIEDVEKQMVVKMAEDCRKSDQLLKENTAKVESCWAKIEECERELYALERERHREVKKRIEDKEKDEQRRMEFERFCQVCDLQVTHLDLTIRNCESHIHACNLVNEFVQSGFNSLAKDFATKTKGNAEVQLTFHREHLRMFRGLLLSLGDLTQKKEKKIEEVDRQIQTSHINQELCADTLNPNAKKFSDAKKELLRIRDDLEQEVRELKQKAADALEKFKISEEALREAEVEYVHPVIENQEQMLETRAKMVEYKAIAIGHVDSVPIRNEIEDLKRQLASTKHQVETINNKASSSTSSGAGTLPVLKAASVSAG